MFANIKKSYIFDVLKTNKMTTFVTVLQVSASQFDVFKFNAATKKAIYPQSSKKGITVTVWESTDQNDKYCFELAEKMNNEKN